MEAHSYCLSNLPNSSRWRVHKSFLRVNITESFRVGPRPYAHGICKFRGFTGRWHFRRGLYTANAPSARRYRLLAGPIHLGINEPTLGFGFALMVFYSNGSPMTSQSRKNADGGFPSIMLISPSEYSAWVIDLVQSGIGLATYGFE